MPKKKKTIAICGYGGMGHAWARDIKNHPDYELRGIIDTDTELLENIPKMNLGLDEDQGYISLEDMVRFGEKPDVVVIATPIPTHSGLVREAMDLGVNVICEKNMASDLHQAKQMVQKAIDHPELCTAVGTQYRYSPVNWAAKKFFELDPNPLGKLGMILWEDWGWRGEKRWSWRRFLPDIYLEDMAVHWFDTMRYITGMDIVQVKADNFMPRYSGWFGSSTVFANLALAKPEHWKDRHEWVWCHFAGDWQRGPIKSDRSSRQEFYCAKGFAKLGQWGVETFKYKQMDVQSNDFEEDGFLLADAGPMEGIGDFHGDSMILEMMSRGIDSGGEKQPGTNFKEAFKSFVVSVACKESSFQGTSVWVPKYWKDFLD
ncbi:MAG: Gfo/Idh/MocA family protein [Candidatus Sigynarchaeota archaeon]